MLCKQTDRETDRQTNGRTDDVNCSKESIAYASTTTKTSASSSRPAIEQTVNCTAGQQTVGRADETGRRKIVGSREKMKASQSVLRPVID